MQDVQEEGVMMRGWASVGMCLCEWACARAGEMRGTHARCVGRRCDDEGVGIHVSVRVGIHVSVRVGIHVSMRVGIHVSVSVGVGMCPCE